MLRLWYNVKWKEVPISVCVFLIFNKSLMKNVYQILAVIYLGNSVMFELSTLYIFLVFLL